MCNELLQGDWNAAGHFDRDITAGAIQSDSAPLIPTDMFAGDRNARLLQDSSQGVDVLIADLQGTFGAEHIRTPAELGDQAGRRNAELCQSLQHLRERGVSEFAGCSGFAGGIGKNDVRERRRFAARMNERQTNTRPEHRRELVGRPRGLDLAHADCRGFRRSGRVIADTRSGMICEVGWHDGFAIIGKRVFQNADQPHGLSRG